MSSVPKQSIEEPLLVAGVHKSGENATAVEAKQLLRLAAPLVASGLLQHSLLMVSVMFVGHLGELPLAGASLAISLANVTGFSLLVGMASALDTLCGQAFGAPQFHLLGVYKQSAMVVLTLACVPIVLAWSYSEQILLLLGQDRAIAAEAGAYARWLIPSLVPYVPLVCYIRFLQTQSIVLPVMASSAVTSLCHVLVCWALVHKAGMGSKGAALSSAFSYSINLAILALYVRMSSACRKTRTGFTMDVFKELRRFAELAVPSAMMLCLNTADLIFTVASGLCTAISTRVSNELGAGHPQAAKRATKVVISIALSGGLVIAITMISLRNFWGYVYSNEEEVVSYIARMIPVLAISYFIDGLHNSLSGVLTGCGKQKIGAHINLGAFYLAGIPMAVFLAFILHLNGMGLWLGIVCGSTTKLLLLTWITIYINWEEEAIKAKEMVLRSSLPVT